MPTIICDDVSVNYHDVGSGELIVLIHCSSSSHRQWRTLWELLQGNFRVVAIDMLNWGETGPWVNKTGDLLETEANIIKEVTKHMGERIHLVGHSYGGTIAYYFSITNPEKIKSLILIEPMLGWILNSAQDAEYYQEIMGVAENFMQKYSAGKLEEGIQDYFDYWNGEGAWENLEESRASYVLAGAEKNYYEFDVIVNGGSGLPSPEGFSHPTLLIGGGDSRRPPLRVLEILEGCLPDARRHLINNATHMSPITHSDKVNSIIQQFLDS